MSSRFSGLGIVYTGEEGYLSKGDERFSFLYSSEARNLGSVPQIVGPESTQPETSVQKKSLSKALMDCNVFQMEGLKKGLGKS